MATGPWAPTVVQPGRPPRAAGTSSDRPPTRRGDSRREGQAAVYRQIAQIPAIDDSEHGGVDAHAQCEGHHDGGGKPAVLDEQSRGETQIVQEGVKGWQPAGFSMPLVEGCAATHANQCGAPRLCGCQASTNVVLGEHRDVRLQFFLEVTIEVAGSEERAHARTPFPKGAEHRSPPRAEL